MVEEEKVYIVVLNWNGWRDTIPCLKSLEYIQGISMHVILVDNGSKDESVQQLKAFVQQSSLRERLTFIENDQNLGFAGGMNTGMERALKMGAQWVLLLNNDTTVDATFARLMVDAAKADGRIGMVNPKIYLGDDPERLWSIGGKLNWMKTKGTHLGIGEIDHGQYDKPDVQDSAYTTGGCLLIRRDVIEKVGMLPLAYFVYYEDVEWSILTQRAGWRTVVVPKARIWHKGAASSREFSEAYIRYHVRNGLLLVRRVGNPVQIIVAYAHSLLRALYQVLKWILVPQKRMWAKAVLYGIADAWRGRSGFIKMTY